MTAVPRSLNDPVGICDSSLNSTGAPCQSRRTSGVQPSPSETRGGPRNASAAA